MTAMFNYFNLMIQRNKVFFLFLVKSPIKPLFFLYWEEEGAVYTVTIICGSDSLIMYYKCGIQVTLGEIEIREEGGHWEVYYTSPQSFIIPFSYNFWDFLFGWFI